MALPTEFFCGRSLVWAPRGAAPEWSFEPYFGTRTSAWISQTFCDVDEGYGAAMVELTKDGDRAAIVMNGVGGNGLALRTRSSLAMMLGAFYESGIGLPPRLEISAPRGSERLRDPASIQMSFHATGRRWDGRSCSVSGLPQPVDESGLSYTILYSSDGGRTYRNALDHSTAFPGLLPPARLRRVDRRTGPESFELITSASQFPAGEYLLRVDAFADGQRLHGAHHVQRVGIDR